MRMRDIILAAAAMALAGGTAAFADEAGDDGVSIWRSPAERTGLPQIVTPPYEPQAEAEAAPPQDVRVEVRIVDERDDLRPPTRLFVPYEAYRLHHLRGKRRHGFRLRVLTPIPKDPIARRIAERASIDHVARARARVEQPPPPPRRFHRRHAWPHAPDSYRDDASAEFFLRMR